MSAHFQPAPILSHCFCHSDGSLPGDGGVVNVVSVVDVVGVMCSSLQYHFGSASVGVVDVSSVVDAVGAVLVRRRCARWDGGSCRGGGGLNRRGCDLKMEMEM